MQASVHRYDRQTGGGEVLTDAGELLTFDAGALAGSGLRHLRVGQRLTVELDTGSAGAAVRVQALRLGSLGTVPAPQV